MIHFQNYLEFFDFQKCVFSHICIPNKFYSYIFLHFFCFSWILLSSGHKGARDKIGVLCLELNHLSLTTLKIPMPNKEICRTRLMWTTSLSITINIIFTDNIWTSMKIRNIQKVFVWVLTIYQPLKCIC